MPGSDVPGALPLSAWIGAYGLSFLVVLAERRRRAAASSAGAGSRCGGLRLVPLLLLPMAARWSLRAGGRRAPVAASTDGVPVRLHPAEHPEPGRVRPRPRCVRNYRKVLRLSREACDARAPWWSGRRARPGRSPTGDDPRFARDLDALAERRLHGAAQLDPRRRASVTTTRPICWRPAGGRRALRQAAPGAVRRVRAAQAASSLHRTSWRATPATSAPPTRSPCCPGGTSSFGMAICFEVVFPDEVADAGAGRRDPRW